MYPVELPIAVLLAVPRTDGADSSADPVNEEALINTEGLACSLGQSGPIYFLPFPWKIWAVRSQTSPRLLHSQKQDC